MKTVTSAPRRKDQVNDELRGKVITSLIQFKLTKESKYYLDAIGLLDELVLETTGPQSNILSGWESALMGVVFEKTGTQYLATALPDSLSSI